jgi:hypothetical protein
MNNEREGEPRTYRGIQMKSRAEARMAAFFDYENVEWRYEPERIGSLQYLPDFFLPEFKIYIEAKPPNVSFSELAKFYLTAPEMPQETTFLLMYIDSNFKLLIWDAYYLQHYDNEIQDPPKKLWASTHHNWPIDLPFFGRVNDAGKFASLRLQ